MTVETLAWETLERHLASGAPWILSMGGTRSVQIGYAASEARLFATLPMDQHASAPPSPFSEIDVTLRRAQGIAVFEISTSKRHFFREFHRFVGLLTEDFESPEETAGSAFAKAAQRWKAFVSSKILLTEDQQLGLYGELLLLEALMRAGGGYAVASWIASDCAMPIRHDFRIEGHDIEVKTTRSAKRRHFINGLRQLEPIPGHKLWVLSLRLEPAGSSRGRTLSNLVNVICKLLLPEPDALTRFEGLLTERSYHHNDSEHYPRQWVLSDLPYLIPVDDQFPRITSAILTEGLGALASSRIAEVAYTVNVDGLGYVEGSPAYRTVLSDARLIRG